MPRGWHLSGGRSSLSSCKRRFYSFNQRKVLVWRGWFASERENESCEADSNPLLRGLTHQTNDGFPCLTGKLLIRIAFGTRAQVGL